MKIRSRSIFTGVAFAALLAASIPSGLRSQQQPTPTPAPPAPMALPVPPDIVGLPAMVENGPGWLGVAIEEVSADKAKELKLPADRGVLLAKVEQDSPAGKAGLQPGDVITEFDGERVEGTLAFRRMVRETPPGRSIEIAYWREGRSNNATVELESLGSQIRGQAQEMAEQARKMAQEQIDRQIAQQKFVLNIPEIEGVISVPTPTLGIGALNLSGQLGNYFGAPDGQGVLVSEVRDATPAAKAGLMAGDVITKLDGERIHNVGELREMLAAKRDEKTVSLTIIRKGAQVSISIEPETPNVPRQATDVSHRVTM